MTEFLSTFEQEIRDTLSAQICHAVEPCVQCEQIGITLAPRVAAAIEAGAEEALAYTGLSAPERVDAVAFMREHALDVLRGSGETPQP